MGTWFYTYTHPSIPLVHCFLYKLIRGLQLRVQKPQEENRKQASGGLQENESG
ncbi:hypothetical protein [Paenibacillus sp. J22TS3]|uniref:hypothetical protein n=1 Tax=Paenibacillus sp. J22TS3 TaxID=2807192 RepID=UPI001B05E1CB|nr:hypothetical protein [Paenibacillus sp. J22TS3]GIP21814.1 hypothetical protein J22TS3_20890 [Paenibacillus sp. J22TS3]